MNDCSHLTPTEAWTYDPETKAETPITDAALCTWADAHPERFVDMPRWMSSWALSGGPNFNPKKHCIGCPGYESVK